MRETRTFEGYGELEELEAEEFYAGDWAPVEAATDEYGEKWEIVFSRSRQEYRYGAI